MKRLIYLILCIPALIISTGCYKSITGSGSAAFTIVNAVYNSNPLVTDFQGASDGKVPSVLTYYNSAAQIGFASAMEFGSNTGRVDLSLSQISDTLVNIWSGSFLLPVGSIHTLFMSGDTLQVDTLLSTDAIPYFPSTDSLSAIRVINLAKGNLPMSINLQGNPGTQTEFTNLSYRQLTSFKSYSIVSSIGGAYNFEIRDLVSDSLLTTYTWNFPLQKSQTLVICGQESTGLSVFTVNDY
jgi:hypothetical protein